MTTQQPFRIGAALGAGAVTFLIPTLVDFLIPIGYGVTVGFQTRGDVDVINQRVMAMMSTPFYLLAIFLVFAAVAFWRGRVLSRRAAGQPLVYAAVIAAVAVALAAGVNLVLRGDSPLSFKTLVELVIVLGFSFLGLSGSGSAAAAPAAR
jgi:hypothetical protein